MTLAVIGMTVPAGREDDSNEDENKTYKTRRRGFRARENLGLPPHDELAKLVESYLKYARELWPGLATKGLLPEPTDPVVADLMAQFIERHRTGVVTLESLQTLRQARIGTGG